MIIPTKKEYLISGLENMIDFIQESKVTEELLIVLDDDFWWRLFWLPTNKIWKITVHKNDTWETPLFKKTREINVLLHSFSNELMKSRGFEYKTYKGTIVYKVED
jgi:hypothetical protein